jgi:diacylglycerol kinase family enzyme
MFHLSAPTAFQGSVASPAKTMLPVERALLIINRSAGTGQGESIADRLTLLFKQSLVELAQVKVELVSDHTAARTCAAAFIRELQAPALVVAGGGGGTLRAVIEGICESSNSEALPGPQRARVGALRMGSGNVLAKQFGVPHDPIIGLNGLLMNLKAGRTVPCCVIRCETFTSSGDSELHHAVTLGGLGQFGRIPSDLARWHARFPILHKSAARLFGIEKLTNVEYVLAVFIRSLSCMLSDCAETVQIQFQDQTERFRLLSGVVMNFPVAALPFKPRVTVEEEALTVYLIPFKGRSSPFMQLVAPQRLIPHTRCMRIEKNQQLEIRFVDRDRVEFFLDEDPATTYRHLTLGIAGSIAFVPGPDYQSIGNGGVSA